MTLSQLAELAADTVEAFVRPRRYRFPNSYSRTWDDSPDALHLAAFRAADDTVRAEVFARRGHDVATEDGARAMLTALLRAHGVEVAE